MSKWVRKPFTTLMFIASAFPVFLFIPAFSFAMQVTIAWDPNDPAPEGYRIYLRTEGQPYDYRRPLWTGNTETAQINNLESEMIYYMVVRAYEEDQESADSEEILVFLTNDHDPDNDGLITTDEILWYNTDPNDSDSDADGIQDGTEIGLSIADIGSDTDHQVFIPDADPTTTTNPTIADTDGDGFDDGEEDSNFNGMLDEGETDPNPQPSPVPINVIVQLLLTQQNELHD